MAVFAAIAAGAVVHTNGNAVVLKERGLWTKAKIVNYVPSVEMKKGRPSAPFCTLDTAEDERISPHLSESMGCGLFSPGQRIDVLYDPEGAVRPRTDEPPHYRTFVAVTTGVAVFFWTLGGATADLGSRPARGRPRPSGARA